MYWTTALLARTFSATEQVRTAAAPGLTSVYSGTAEKYWVEAAGLAVLSSHSRARILPGNIQSHPDPPVASLGLHFLMTRLSRVTLLDSFPLNSFISLHSYLLLVAGL